MKPIWGCWGVGETGVLLFDKIKGFRASIEKAVVTPAFGWRESAPRDLFPKGWCQDASFFLAEFLIGNFGAREVYIGRGQLDGPSNQSHAWVEWDGLALDITADQFGARYQPVIVLPLLQYLREFSIAQRSRQLFKADFADEMNQKALRKNYRIVLAQASK